MGTLTHDVGRRYFTTGIFPRGLQPVGSSLTSHVAEAYGSQLLIPNISLQTESYYEGTNAYAAPISVPDATTMTELLVPLGAPLPAGSDAITAWEAAAHSCRRTELDGSSLVAMFDDSRIRANAMVTSGLESLFKFTQQSPVLAALKGDNVNANDLTGAVGLAGVAAQALQSGIAQAVSVQLASQLDDHDSWAQNHPQKIYDGLKLLGNLISYLKTVNVEGTAETVWSRTTLLVFSEFARGPRINTRDGRDHHLASSCLVAGPGIRGNQMIGATDDETMAVVPYDPGSGVAAPLRPVDVHRTLLESMGITDVELGTQLPVIIEPMLK
jgi:hypothetical protein